MSCPDHMFSTPKKHKYGAAFQAAVIKRVTQQPLSHREGQILTPQIDSCTFRVAQRRKTLESNKRAQLYSQLIHLLMVKVLAKVGVWKKKQGLNREILVIWTG